MKLEILMQSLWKEYLKTKDINFLAKACEKAPSLGKKKWEKKLLKF